MQLRGAPRGSNNNIRNQISDTISSVSDEPVVAVCYAALKSFSFRSTFRISVTPVSPFSILRSLV